MKYTSLLVGVLIILGVGFYVYKESNEASDPLQIVEAGTPSVSETPAGAQEKQYTAVEVAAHATRESCWSLIDGAVYDLTSWIPKHPGGERAILKLCGIDGSEEFNEQHGGQSVQLKVLAGFKIGTVQSN